MSYIVVCPEEIKSLKIPDDPDIRHIGDAQGPFEFVNEAFEHVKYIEGRTEPRKAGMICHAKHIVMRVEKPMPMEEALKVDEYIRRLEAQS